MAFRKSNENLVLRKAEARVIDESQRPRYQALLAIYDVCAFAEGLKAMVIFEFRDSFIWALEFKTWKDFCEQALHISMKRANMLAADGAVAVNLLGSDDPFLRRIRLELSRIGRDSSVTALSLADMPPISSKYCNLVQNRDCLRVLREVPIDLLPVVIDHAESFEPKALTAARRSLIPRGKWKATARLRPAFCRKAVNGMRSALWILQDYNAPESLQRELVVVMEKVRAYLGGVEEGDETP